VYRHAHDLNDDDGRIGAGIINHEHGRNYTSDPASNHDVESGTDGTSASGAPPEYRCTQGHEPSTPGGELQAGNAAEGAIPEGEHQEPCERPPRPADQLL
jgi:hypothetical protein